jgi:hypothetical protein
MEVCTNKKITVLLSVLLYCYSISLVIKRGLLLGKYKNIGGNGNNCVGHFGLQPKVIVFGTSAFS